MCHFCNSKEPTIVYSLSYTPISVDFCKRCADSDKDGSLRTKPFIFIKYLRHGIDYIKNQNITVFHKDSYVSAIDFLNNPSKEDIDSFEFKRALKERLIYDFLLKKRISSIKEND